MELFPYLRENMGKPGGLLSGGQQASCSGSFATLVNDGSLITSGEGLDGGEGGDFGAGLRIGRVSVFQSAPGAAFGASPATLPIARRPPPKVWWGDGPAPPFGSVRGYLSVAFTVLSALSIDRSAIDAATIGHPGRWVLWLARGAGLALILALVRATTASVPFIGDFLAWLSPI